MNSTEIISDDESIKVALETLLDILKKNDCHFDSNIFISCNEGNLGIYAKQPIDAGTTLISISELCLLPVEDLTLKLNGDDIVLTDNGSSLSSLRKDIVYALINVFNLTKKISHYNRTHPAILHDSSTELYNKLLEGRSASDDIYKTNNKNKSDIKIQQMLKSRTMLYKRADKKAYTKTDMIMPVIDFFNHNIDATPFSKTGASFKDYKLSVAATVYDQASMEYYVSYGYFDAYDMFLRYGYVDQNVNFVYSIPMTISLPFFGTIIVNCITGELQDGFNFNIDENKVEFLYLSIPCGDDLFSLRHKLYSAISKMSNNFTGDKINAYVQSAESIILSRNIAFYEELKSFVPGIIEKKTETVISSVSSLIDVQLQKLRSYPYV